MLPIVVNNETYLTAAEAARLLDISRDTFNRNVSEKLHPYRFGALRRTYYLQSEVERYQGPQLVEPEK